MIIRGKRSLAIFGVLIAALIVSIAVAVVVFSMPRHTNSEAPNVNSQNLTQIEETSMLVRIPEYCLTYRI